MKEMSSAGVYIGTIATRAPYMLGKVERHGDMWKEIAAPVIEARNTTGIRVMQMLAAEVSAIMNERNRRGGFSPAQWVLARQPRYSAGEQADDELAYQLGSMEERDDPTTIFAERMAMRHEAKKAHT